MKEVCEQRIKDIQKYVPVLRSLIEKLEKNSSDQVKLKQVKCLHNVILKLNDRIPLDVFIKCEDILKRVSQNPLQDTENSAEDTLLESRNVHSETSEADTKENIQSEIDDLTKMMSSLAEDVVSKAADGHAIEIGKGDHGSSNTPEVTHDERQEKNITEMDESSEISNAENTEEVDIELEKIDKSPPHEVDVKQSGTLQLEEGRKVELQEGEVKEFEMLQFKKEGSTENTRTLNVLECGVVYEETSKLIKTPLEEVTKTELVDAIENKAKIVEELEYEKANEKNRNQIESENCNEEEELLKRTKLEKVQQCGEVQVPESEVLQLFENEAVNFETQKTDKNDLEGANVPELKQDETECIGTQSSIEIRVEEEEICSKKQLQKSEVLGDENEHFETQETEKANVEAIKTPELQQSELESTDIQSPKEVRLEEEEQCVKDDELLKAQEYNVDIVKLEPEGCDMETNNSFDSHELQIVHVETQSPMELNDQKLESELEVQHVRFVKAKTEPEKDIEDVNTSEIHKNIKDSQILKVNESPVEEVVEEMIPGKDIVLKSNLQQIEEMGEENNLTNVKAIFENSNKSTSDEKKENEELYESAKTPKELDLDMDMQLKINSEIKSKGISKDSELHQKVDSNNTSNEIKHNLVYENRDTKVLNNRNHKGDEELKVVEGSELNPAEFKGFIENGKQQNDMSEKNQAPPVNSKIQSSARPEKLKNKNCRVSIIKTRSASKNAIELAKSKVEPIKAIEVKTKDSSEKSALLYVVNKAKPVETIELLDSDSEDDDVVIVSVSGLKRKPITTEKIVSQKIKFPQPKVFKPKPSHIIVPQINQPMFAITSVKSINQSVSVANRPDLVIQPAGSTTNSSSTLTYNKPFCSTAVKRKNSESQSLGKSRSNKSKSSKTTRETLDSSSSLDESTNDSVTNAALSIKECQQTVEWVENFVANVLSPSQNVTPFGMELLQKTLDMNSYGTIKNVIEENKKKYNITSFELENSVADDDQRSGEMRSLFVKNNLLTDLGCKLATISKQTSNRVYTTDRKTGQVTSKSRKKPKELEDTEYSPSIIVKFAEQTVANRRESLRRESKTNRKQYFAYEDDDDTEFLKMLEEQAKMEAASAKTKKKTRRRINGSAKTPVRVKKMRLQEGFSVNTPFESDLLTPTWVEDSVLVGTEQYLNLQTPQESQEAEENLENTISQELEENNAYASAALGLPFKNINRAHHCRSKFIDSCILCKVKHNFVVAHYVNQHRDSEVIISRLTQRDTDQLVKAINCGYLITSKSSAHQYSATCVFCKREMKFALRYWWEHYTMHTGEYGYECSRCQIRRPRRQHAQRHANNECKIAQATVKVVYPFDKTKNQIVAYICKLCNYIQLHHENVMKHLRSEHEMKSKLNDNIVKVILLQISRSGSSTGSFNYYENSGNSQYGENSYQNYDPNDENQSPFMQYSDGTPQDDLSFMICGMLAIDDPSQVAETCCEPEAEDEMVLPVAPEAQIADMNS